MRKAKAETRTSPKKPPRPRARTTFKKIIGDLSNTHRVLVGLDLNPRTEN